ncbi:MAG: DNA repair protein RecN [Mariprofundaceae bacterium]
MLTSLSIRQFALIDDVHLDLGPGMTAFTGETGAGKSILIDALGAVFGARASSDWVRHGADRAEIVAVWEGMDAPLAALLEEHELETGDELVLRRVIGADGRSRAWINGLPAPVRLLQRIGETCLDLHGQHEHQRLLAPDFQRALLDARLPERVLAETEQAWAHWSEARRRLADFRARQGEDARQADWMRAELARLDELDLEPGCLAALEREVEAGRHHAQIRQAAAEALQALDEGEPNARALIGHAMQALARVASMHDAIEAAAGLAAQAETLIGELAPELRAVAERDFDEAAFARAEERLMRLHEAMRRHGVDEDGLIALRDEWRERLAAMDTAEWDEEALVEALDAAATEYRRRAGALTRARRAAAQEIETALRPLLDRLALGGMQVRFAIEPSEAEAAGWHAWGWDAVGIRVMSNPGEPWRDLAAVASGGELSRLVLAFKGCGALRAAPRLAVFDEVDVGIGGETAWSVGALLAAMGRERQVLAISHLPQVAACADAHVAIRKHVSDGRTVSRARVLDEDEREAEIARMLGGEGEESLRHARAMLARGRGRA